MDTLWTSLAEFCNEDGSKCYCTAKKTRVYLCEGCKLVDAPLVKKGYLCAVCFRSSVLATQHRFCIGKPCHEVHQEHLAIQIRKREEQLEILKRREQERLCSSTSASVHPSPAHDPWDVHDGCSAKRSHTSWWEVSSELSTFCHATSCSPSASSSVPPQCAERHVHRLQVSSGTSSTTPSASSATVVTVPQPIPEHDPWAVQEGSGTQCVAAPSQSTPTRCAPCVKPEARLLLASSESLPQCPGDASDLSHFMIRLMHEVQSANVQLETISANVVEILNNTRAQNGVPNAME